MKFAKNPLPGMNPWLEAYWGDVHTRLTMYACDTLQKQLPDSLQARVEEYLSVTELEEDAPVVRRIVPDVQIVERTDEPVHADVGGGLQTLVAEAPVRIRRRAEPQTLRYIEIVDLRAGRRVVTAIEFISLANKSTEAGRRQYFAKQRQLIDAEVNLVEIDLLRSGKWVMAAERECYPARLQRPYRICVVRSKESEDAEIYQATFAHPLPRVRIPLRDTDDDILLPLQELIDLAYENGRYGNDVDYSVPPEPPLEDQEQKWIAAFLAKRSESPS